MLKINEISKIYGSKTVVDKASFQVPDGKICALLGLNGAGKSTIMKIICNLAFADSGSIEFDGKKYIDNREGKIGFMIESPSFYGDLTGKNNLRALSLLYDNIPNERIDEVLKICGLYSHKDILVKKYSLGMKQRLYFAYAILNKPKLLVLDEPFNGIDPVSVNLFKQLILDCVKTGASVLISGHMISEIQSISDCAVIIDNGKIIYEDYEVKDKNLTEIFLSLVSWSGAAQ